MAVQDEERGSAHVCRTFAVEHRAPNRHHILHLQQQGMAGCWGELHQKERSSSQAGQETQPARMDRTQQAAHHERDGEAAEHATRIHCADHVQHACGGWAGNQGAGWVGQEQGRSWLHTQPAPAARPLRHIPAAPCSPVKLVYLLPWPMNRVANTTAMATIMAPRMAVYSRLRLYSLQGRQRGGGQAGRT